MNAITNALVYMAVGMIITEGIVLIYFRYFASPEEIMQALKISKESMASEKWLT